MLAVVRWFVSVSCCAVAAQLPQTPAQPLPKPAQPPQTAMPSALLETLQWRSIGPSRAGRASGVCGVVSERDTYYMASCGGGVWKTSDAGRSWRNISDGYFGGSVGAVAVAASDANVIYAGTGEKTVRGNVSSGDGVWKSTDAGKSWQFVGLGDSRHVGRIRIHPRDPNLVYVAAMGHVSGPNDERGVFRSKDGGTTWQKVLFVNAHAGAVDLCLDPRNPRVLYATTWRVLRTPYSLESGGEGSGLWQSTDGGDSWVDLSRRDGLPKGTLGIIGITVSPAQSSRLYAMVEADDGGLFRSDDGGGKWTRVNDDRNLRQRAWYYTRVHADPLDADVVYVLNVGFHRSKDGGKTFTAIGTPHGDNHDLWIDPHDPRRMIECNDGGAGVSFDGGATWSPNDNQPTAQFYRVTTDRAVPYRIYGAQQDSSTLRIRSRSDRGRGGDRDWEPTAGSESGHIAVHPRDDDVVFGGNYGGSLERFNHKTAERRLVNVWPDNPMGWGAAELRYRFQWNFPIFFSPHAPYPLYTAANVLFRSDDQGQSWRAISGDLTRNDKSKQGPSGGPITKDNTSVEYYCTIFAACESPAQRDLLWCGSDDGLVHVSRDGGKQWHNVTPAWPEWSMVNCIEPHPSQPGTAYVAATRYKLDDFSPQLWRTHDFGATWQGITRGIAANHFTRAIRCDPMRPGLLYAGTERGVYVSFDDGAHWQPLQLNLPITPITDLTIKDDDLIAATQGRAFWVFDQLAHLRQIDSAMAEDAVHLFAPAPTLRGAGAVARLFLKELAKDTPVQIVWRTADGLAIRTLATDAKEARDKLSLAPGMNRLNWDLRYPSAKEVPGMILWGGGTVGPRATPGKYHVQVTIGKDDQARTLSREFEVRGDPRATATADDYAAQLDFLLTCRDKLTEVHETILRLRTIREQVNGVVKRAPGAPHQALRELGATIVKESTTIEEALYQTKNRSNQDPLNYPIRLNDKLANLMSVVSTGDFRPTDQAVAFRTELFVAIDAELAKATALTSDAVARFERLAREAAVPYVLVETDGK